MYCKNCGQKLPDGAMFCDSCGVKLSSVNQQTNFVSVDEHSKNFEKLPSLGFGQSISNCFSNYANFSGRARRSEYWYFVIFESLIIFLGSYIFGTVIADKNLLLIFWIICGLVLIIPSWAVVVRRLHDTNKSGWFALINFIPYGGVILFILCCFDSQKEENEYGKSPKYVEK